MSDKPELEKTEEACLELINKASELYSASDSATSKGKKKELKKEAEELEKKAEEIMKEIKDDKN